MVIQFLISVLTLRSGRVGGSENNVSLTLSVHFSNSDSPLSGKLQIDFVSKVLVIFPVVELTFCIEKNILDTPVFSIFSQLQAPLTNQNALIVR